MYSWILAKRKAHHCCVLCCLWQSDVLRYRLSITHLKVVFVVGRNYSTALYCNVLQDAERQRPQRTFTMVAARQRYN